MEKEKKKKKQRKFSIIAIIAVIIIIIFIAIAIFLKGKNSTSQQRNYIVNVELVSVATLNDDDIFYTKLKDQYNGYKLLFVSLNIVNNELTNYDNLSYNLTTSNNNSYDKATSYITDDEEFIENYYKINNKIFNDSTNDLLGNQNKRVIIGFMIPESELINDTTFTVEVESFYLNSQDVQKVQFNSSEIIKSYTMKELYKEDELEKAEQTISLAYLSSINNWLQWMIYLEQAYNYQYNDLFSTAFTAIKTFVDSANYGYGWNGRNVETDGFKLDFDKAKEFYPDIANQIETAKNATIEVNELYQSYNNNINNLDKNKMQKMDSDVLSFNKIKDYFGLTYTY